jgi:hypothetical protein
VYTDACIYVCMYIEHEKLIFNGRSDEFQVEKLITTESSLCTHRFSMKVTSNVEKYSFSQILSSDIGSKKRYL